MLFDCIASVNKSYENKLQIQIWVTLNIGNPLLLVHGIVSVCEYKAVCEYENMRNLWPTFLNAYSHEKYNLISSHQGHKDQQRRLHPETKQLTFNAFDEINRKIVLKETARQTISML